MRAPLGVQISDGLQSRSVQKYVQDLRFTKTAPGGPLSANMRINLPRDTFPGLGPADRLDISDGRTGRMLWSGFTDNPGSTDGTSGQFFDLSAMGSNILASDEARAYSYVDTDTSRWTQDKGANAAPSAQAGQGGDPAGVAADGLLMQFPPGQPIGTNSCASLRYSLGAFDMEFGALQVTVQSGKTDSGYRAELAWFGTPGSGSFGLGSTSQISTTPVVVGARFVNDSFSPPDGMTSIGLRLRRSGGATTVADDNTWTLFNALSICGRRMDRNGTLLSGVAGHVSATYVLASWVVEDLLGRVLHLCDPVTATVDTTTFQIDQLAFTEAVRASEVLDALVETDPDYLWEILERQPSGLYKFNWRAWPAEARYEISVKDGYQAPGADVDLCNRIAVSYTDKFGIKRVLLVGAYVEELGNKSPILSGAPDPTFVGRIRDAEPIELPEGRGSAANAQRIGEQVLAAKADPPKACKAVVRRELVDLLTGHTVSPWEIEPGYPVRVRETGDMLRMTEMEYADDDCAATLTLGEPQLSTEQRMARLAKVRKARAA